MKQTILLLFLVLAIYQYSWAQCPSVDFTLPPSACKTETFSPTFNTTGAASFNWDFCDGSIANLPSSVRTKTVSSLSSPFDIKFVEENGKAYGFAVNLGDGSIIKFDFGADLSTDPTITNMGNLGVISGALGINFWEEGGVKFALVITNPGDVFLLNFGASITNTPTATKIPSLTGLSNHRHVKIIKDNGSLLALMAGGSSGKLSILNFGSSILNNPTQSAVSIPSASIPTGLDVVIDCNKRYAIVSGYGSGIHLLNFGTSFLNTPTFVLIATVALPLGVSVIKSIDNYYILVSSEAEGIVRYNLGSSISTNTTPSKTTLGKFSTIDVAIGFTVVKQGSKYFGVCINLNNQILTVLAFPKACEILSAYDNISTPSISYQNEGNYNVTLNAIGSNNELVSLTKNFEVSYGKDLTIATQNECVNQDVFHSFNNAPQNVVQTDWDFDDGNVSTSSNPTHQFSSAGVYDVSLKITGSNGCTNTFIKSVAVYNPANPDFDLPPASPLCSNQLYSFKNTSTFDVGSTPSYQWKVDGLNVSSATDLSYTFTDAVDKQIDLVTTIPGCPTQITKTISSIAVGPVVDFLSTGNCMGDAYQFTNTTQGNPDSYSWDFGDGQNSTTPDAQHIFSSAGVKQVSLTASNTASGCNNMTLKSITVYSKPQPNFSLALPPFSCTGTPSQFNDLTPNPTDSNLSTWLWNFDDAASGTNTASTKNPKHTYANAGDYDVSLTATTNFNCSATIQKTVTIAQTPNATFTNTPACKNQAITFSADIDNKSWFWQMGSTYYFFENPTHTFTTSGDHTVSLTITGNNNCVASINKVIKVPAPIMPDFTVEKMCSNQNTTFIDTSPASSDPISSYSWKFGDTKIGTGSPSTHTYTNTGTYSITMDVVTEEGCKYSKVKPIAIGTPPTASFTASPESGAPPLIVEFTNTSTNAISYVWAYNDELNTTTTEVSPTFTFQNQRDYVVDLTASNVQGCTNTFSKLIKSASSLNDVILTAFSITDENKDGVFNGIVSIKNNGNLEISNIKLSLDLSNTIVIRENIKGPIAANSSLNYLIGYEILNTKDLQFVCAEVALANDLNPDNNKKCTNVNETTWFWLDAYPNPANQELHIDWIAKEAGVAKIKLVDRLGKAVTSMQLESVIGLNQTTFLTDKLSAGIYILSLEADGSKKTQRIAVTGN